MNNLNIMIDFGKDLIINSCVDIDIVMIKKGILKETNYKIYHFCYSILVLIYGNYSNDCLNR